MKTVMPSVRSLLVAITCVFAISACTSNIDSIPNPDISDSSVTPGGIYTGTLSTLNPSSSTPITALITNKNQMAVFATDGSQLLSGLYSTANNGFSANLRQFDLSGAQAPLTLGGTGTFDQGAVVHLQYTRSDNVSGAIDLPSFNDTAYNTRSALALLAGTWVNQDQFGQFTTQFTLDGTGNISGTSSTPNCSYNGTIQIIDLRYNLYSVKTLNESCSGSSTMQTLSGLATIMPATTSTPNPTLVMALASTTEGRLFQLTQQ